LVVSAIFFFFLMFRPRSRFTLFPYTTLFRSVRVEVEGDLIAVEAPHVQRELEAAGSARAEQAAAAVEAADAAPPGLGADVVEEEDRKSTRLNSSHVSISYAVFCLKKKKTNKH